MFDGHCPESPEIICATMLSSLPLVYSSLQEHQRDDVVCLDLRRKVENQENCGKKFLHL
jgi:hypothetical protein